MVRRRFFSAVSNPHGEEALLQRRLEPWTQGTDLRPSTRNGVAVVAEAQRYR
jgi:hypothetical protein